MFWKSKNTDDRIIENHKKQIDELKNHISIIKHERDLLKEKLTIYESIIKSIPLEGNKEFKPHSNIKDAVMEFKKTFPHDFTCLDEVNLDILNIFLARIDALKKGDYIPSSKSIEQSKDFFNFEKTLVKREYLKILYNLLDIKITTRQFETFNSEISNDELISIIEKIFFYIELRKVHSRT